MAKKKKEIKKAPVHFEKKNVKGVPTGITYCGLKLKDYSNLICGAVLTRVTCKTCRSILNKIDGVPNPRTAFKGGGLVMPQDRKPTRVQQPIEGAFGVVLPESAIKK